MDNIILIGMPATGKSTVGVVLAKLIGYDFIDVDILIAKEQGLPLCQIIAQEGYERFIEIEGKAGTKLNCEKTVVATGGSMVFSEAAMKNLSSLGKLVWIDSPLAELEKRVSGSLAERGVAAPEKMTMGQIFDLRRPLYEKYADVKIDGRGNAQAVVSLIRESLNI